MKIQHFTIYFLIAVFSFAFIQKPKQPNQNKTHTKGGHHAGPKNEHSLIEKGEYLVGIMGCNDCHSPKIMGKFGPEPDPERLLSGYIAGEPLPPINKSGTAGWVLFNMSNTAAVGPWGVSFAGNLTSDETGIGNWSYEQFKIALTQGKYKGIETARPLLPPMPWPNYIKMKDEDIKAVYAYLKSTKPIKNTVPDPITPDKL